MEAKAKAKKTSFAATVSEKEFGSKDPLVPCSTLGREDCSKADGCRWGEVPDMATGSWPIVLRLKIADAIFADEDQAAIASLQAKLRAFEDQGEELGTWQPSA